jgi:dihydroflavonol-4-reductase
VTGRKSVKIVLSRALMLTLGSFGTLMNHLGLKWELNRVNAAILCTNAFYSSEKAVKELNLPLTPITTGIKESLDWFQENKCL